MGNLPETRITPSRTFQHTDVDYAGPIQLRSTKGRGHKAFKAFIAIFVCFSTRAVYLEVVSDYTADAFLAAFRRFVSRRGLCQTLRQLFKAASKENQQIAVSLANDRVQWLFNPPAASHFGGLWEAAVKAMKHHLHCVIVEATLTYEEMATFLTQVEACLNSRPLSSLSDDPDDLSALTTGHFLIGGPLTAVPEPSLSNEPSNRLSRWQLLQQMRDHLWKRWTGEYLQSLQARNKWWTANHSQRRGDLCLIRGEVTPPSKWLLVRITQLYPGDDGFTRVVTVRTATSEIKRSLTKLVFIPAS